MSEYGGVTEPEAGGSRDDGAVDPQPLGVELVPTGNVEVDASLERLADADALPTEGHIEVYEDVHRGLRETLAALDSRPGPPGPVPAAPPTTYDDRR